MAHQEPVTLLEYQTRFATDEACLEQLFRLRWPEGFRCPRCGRERYYFLTAGHLHQCQQCRYQVSVTAGTVFHRSQIPLRKWFWAVFLVMSDNRGISALFLSRTLSICYETAWFTLHRIGQAMEPREDQYHLQGLVEMDDGYFDGTASTRLSPSRPRRLNR